MPANRPVLSSTDGSNLVGFTSHRINTSQALMSDLPQFIWPLFGVLLGWLLSAVSSGWKSRGERRKVAGRLLAALLDVRNNVRTLRVVSGQMKGALEEPKKYEDFRQHIHSKYFLDSSGSSEISKLIAELSGYRPIAAYELNGAMALLSRSKSAKLSAISTNPEAYKDVLVLHELGLQLVEKQLTQVVRALALDHGVITGIRLFVHLTRADKVAPPNEEFVAAFGKATLDKFNERPRV